MSGTEPGTDAIDWSLTTWEGSRREQLRRWAKVSLSAWTRERGPAKSEGYLAGSWRIGASAGAPCSA